MYKKFIFPIIIILFSNFHFDLFSQVTGGKQDVFEKDSVIVFDPSSPLLTLEEINQNKTSVFETPKYLNFMTKIIKDDDEEDFKDVNELISPIKENLKKIKIIERIKEEEKINLIETKKNEKQVNNSNSQAKLSATYKTKSFEPLKRIKTMKNLNGGLNKNSISPKKIMKKLAK